MSAADEPGDVTLLLRRAGKGDQQAEEQLFGLVAVRLRQIADACLGNQRPLYSLQTTLLVDDAFLDLVRDPKVRWEGRGHFFGLAAVAIRSLIVGAARRELAKRRGGGRTLTPLHEAAEPPDARTSAAEEVLALHDALTRLEDTHPELAEVVQLYHFGGRTLEEVGGYLGVSVETIKRRWRAARALLHRELRPEGDSHDS